jgi:molecular chaperone GrpE
VSAELNSAEDPGPMPSEAALPEAAPGPESPPDGERLAEPEPPAAVDSAAADEVPFAELSAAVRRVADLSQRYHARAEQREGVIDFLRSELETLRRGERRGLLRPVLVEMCRLREDLLAQAETLPADFDAAKAADLLRSYAETLELALESNGVTTYTPDNGDRFDPRLHRRVGGEASADPALAGHVARVRRDGYLDIEANSSLMPAEVNVFAFAERAAERAGEERAGLPDAAVREGAVASSAAAVTSGEGQQ